MLAIVALALLAHIGPTTRPRRDNRPPGEYVICRDPSVIRYTHDYGDHERHR